MDSTCVAAPGDPRQAPDLHRRSHRLRRRPHPTLDLDATSSAGSTDDHVNVAGPANNPTVTFSSSPALPQDEILAQLIFNRSLNNLSAFQIAQLASAVGQLAAADRRRCSTACATSSAVDDLDITTDESGGAQVPPANISTTAPISNCNKDRTPLPARRSSTSTSAAA
ncbi:hypothetical protein F2981_04335 [Sinorhizobium meliloti]|nr:hypothetical protein [Sinorhizobium meliloti]